MKLTLVRLGLMALVTSALVACSSGGSDGINGTNGAQGPQGPSGANISVAALSTDEWAALKLQGQVTKVEIGADGKPEVSFTLTDMSGNPISGLENNTSKSSTALFAGYTNVALSIAKLVPGTEGGASKWVSYIVTTVPTTTSTTSVAGRPTTDNTGTLTYSNGTYTYKFWRDIKSVKDVVAATPETAANKNVDLGDLTFDPSLTHRVAVQISGNARGTGNNTSDASTTGPAVLLKDPINLIYDFIPATGRPVTSSDTQREIVSVKSCFECHTKFVGFHGSTPELGLSGIGASRQDTRMCMVCHTDQRKYGRTNATETATGYSGNTYRVGDKSLLDFPTFVHKIHMGEELVKTGYNIAGLEVNEIRFPQLITNCTKCHDGAATAKNKTAQGDNWFNVPTRAACGACHDGLNFATGTGTNLDGSTTGHGKGGPGGAQADDKACAGCHAPAGIKADHVSVTPPDSNSNLFAGGTNGNTNSAWLASNWDNLPAGAIKVSYDVKSVSRNASKQPVIVFRLLQNGVAVPFNDPAVKTEMWDNFMGSPSAYFVFAVPQDGITKPADFNASASGYLRTLWKGGASAPGTLTYDSATGYYTATLTRVLVPDNATMLTGGLGYTYAPLSTMPLTQTNLPDYPVAEATGSTSTGMPNKTGGLIVVAPDAQKVATNYTGRREIVEDARCNNCHKELGVFNKSQFHAGQRNDGTTCAWCHTPNRASSGWVADSTSFVHAIHGAAKRGPNAPFTWHAASTTEGFWKIGFPGVLSNCETCHKPGTYDFSNAANRTAADFRLYRTAATGFFNGTAGTVNKGFSATTCAPSTSVQSAEGAFALAPEVIKDNATFYGLGFTFNAGATSASTLCDGTGTPITVAAQTSREADPQTLVKSPMAAVCTACHTTSLAKLHMEDQGASIYAPRSTALATTERCFICHDSGRIADIKKVHSK